MNNEEKNLSKKELEAIKAKENKETNERLDKDYDGYYDDVEVKAEKKHKSSVDKDVVKKIGGIVGFAVVAIIISLIIIFK